MKTKIRNISLLIVALILVLSCCLALVGCGDSGETKTNDPTEGEGEGGDDVSSGGSAIVYTLTFDLNYDGSTPIAVTVTNGSYTMPSDPEREGYAFAGWYADKDGSTSFDFSDVSGSATVYASWIARREGYSLVTFKYNLEGLGVCSIVEAETGVDRVSTATGKVTATASGYKFMGWYTDADCTTQAVGNTTVTGDMTLYAYWYKGWTFEAEQTDLYDPYENDGVTMRKFQGFSENGNPVKSDSTCSNGQYIGDMYQKELYIYFAITSDKEVTDATVSMRAAMDYGFYNFADSGTSNVSITSSQFTMAVNGATKSYNTMTFNGAANLSSGERTSFSTYNIVSGTDSITLKAEENTIRFTTNNENKGEGGTQLGMAPLIDYIVIYVPMDVTLTMDVYSYNAE